MGIRENLTSDGRLLLKLPNGCWVHFKYKLAMLLNRSNKVSKYLYLEKAGFELESFVYVYPYKEQFCKQHWLHLLGYRFNALLGLNLFLSSLLSLRKNNFSV